MAFVFHAAGKFAPRAVIELQELIMRRWLLQATPPCTEDVCLERHLAMRAMRLLDDSSADIPQIRYLAYGVIVIGLRA